MLEALRPEASTSLKELTRLTASNAQHLLYPSALKETVLLCLARDLRLIERLSFEGGDARGKGRHIPRRGGRRDFPRALVAYSIKKSSNSRPDFCAFPHDSDLTTRKVPAMSVITSTAPTITHGLVTRVLTKLPIETGQVQLRISSTRK